MKKRVLISVTNKIGLEKFKALVEAGWEIISTGGTATALEKLGIPCIKIEEITKFPEMLDGRVKTLHPNVFGGILAKRDVPKHMQEIADHLIEMIDLVVVNLYDFEEKPGIENIDVGGPSMLRAAAKNCAHVGSVIDPGDYDFVIAELIEAGSLSKETLYDLAIKVFKHTGRYDICIASWMERQRAEGRAFDAPQPTAH